MPNSSRHGRNADQHPLEEADLHAELGADEPDPDHIGRRADRRGQAADRGGERGHQHERRRRSGGSIGARLRIRAMAARIDRPIPNIMAVVAVLEIHQEMSAVTAPKASRIRLGRAADPGEREDGVGQPAVEPVNEDGAGQDEGADEEEHQRVGKRGEHVLGRGDLRARRRRHAPSSAVTGSGSASVTQSTTTAARTAASRWAGSESPSRGRMRKSRKTAGARKAPTRRCTLLLYCGVDSAPAAMVMLL